jgi:hypothetical protein
MSGLCATIEIHQQTREKEMSDTKYNGWTNKATWATNLWLSNDEFLYKNLNRELRAEATEDSTADELAEIVREFANIHLGAQARTEIGDFDEVDWAEVAQDWVDELVL